MVTADEVARWAAALPAGRPARRARARVRRPSTRPTTGCCASRARSTSATSLLRAVALLRDKPARARARLRALAPRARRRRPGPRARRPAPRRGARQRARRADRRGRRRLRGAPRARRGAREPARPGRRAAGRAHACAWSARCARRPPCCAAAQAVVAPIEGRIEKAADAAAGRQRALLALRQRARPGPGRRGRDRAARALGASRPSEIGGARALRAQRGPGDRRRARGARGALRPGRRDRVLPARRGQGRARLAAAARRPRRRRRRRARPRPPADRAALDRPRALRADRPPAQARHGRRARGRDRVAPAAARGPRAHPAASSSCTARPRARWTPRAPTSSCTASSTASGCAASSSSPPRPTSSSGSCRSRAWATWRPPTSAARRRRPGATSPATWRRWPRPGLHDDEEGAGEGRHGAVCVLAMHAAQGREFRHVFVLGLQSARMPGARRRLAEPIPDALLHEELAGRHPRRARRRHAPAAARRDDPRARGARPRLRRALGRAARCSTPRRSWRRRAPRCGAEWEERAEELFGPDETLHATFTTLRDELLRSIPRTGGRLGELRLDTDLDVAHGAVRYLELVKLAALMDRPDGPVGGRRAAGDQRRAAAARPPPSSARSCRPARSTTCCSAPSTTRAPAPPRIAARDGALAGALPAHAAATGLLLSASDIETYRTCPLKYKFARVFRIPSEPTLNQRFGILVHQVLERYHQSGGRTIDELLGLLEAGWRRGGFGASDQERQLHAKADGALRRYYERFRDEDARAAVVREGLQLPHGRAHPARARGPRRPPARRRLRAHRLQDRAPAQRRPAARGRPALALRGRRARGVGPRLLAPVLPLRARRREGPAAGRGGRPRLDRRDRLRGRRRHPRRRASSRRRPTRRARSATTGSPARRPSADERPAAAGGACGQPLVRRARGAARLLADDRPRAVRGPHRRQRQRQVDGGAHDRRPARAERGRGARRGLRPAPRARGRARPRARWRSCPTTRCSTTT